MKLGEVFKEKKVSEEKTLPKVKVINIHYSKLRESQYQYRSHSKEDVEDLAELIRVDGKVQQPLRVRRSGADEYEILVGHGRYAASKLLAETGLEQYAFLPCIEEQLQDARAEFMVYSSNRFTPKTPYEEMVEIEGMIRLLKEHPEEFPEAGSGRTVEKLSRLLGITQTKIKEYQAISHNLTAEGKAALQAGTINKSVAYQLSRLPAEKQKEHLQKADGLTINDIKKKESNVSESDTQKKTCQTSVDIEIDCSERENQEFRAISYTDKRGWKYKVMPGIGGTSFKGRYQDAEHMGNYGWHGIHGLMWRDSFQAAQEELDAMAKVKGWRIADDSNEPADIPQEITPHKEKNQEQRAEVQEGEASGENKSLDNFQENIGKLQAEENQSEYDITVKEVWQEEQEKLQEMLALDSKKPYGQIRRQEIIVAALEALVDR